MLPFLWAHSQTKTVNGLNAEDVRMHQCKYVQNYRVFFFSHFVFVSGQIQFSVLEKFLETFYIFESCENDAVDRETYAFN